MTRLDDKVALVTGAVSGIGRATARQYSDAGAKVVVADLDADAARAAAADLPGPAIGVGCNVADSAAATAAVEATVGEFGRIDILANIAGVLLFEHTHLVTDEQWQRVLDVNVNGTFFTTRAALGPMLEQGAGTILNTASSAAYRASAWAAAYGASKGAVVAFTQAIAVEYGRQGIRCNAVAPAGVRTNMMDDFRFPKGVDASLVERVMPFDGELSPDDIAAAFVFLGSDEADRINGICLKVDDAMMA